jgi:DNA polymerase
MIAHLDFEVYSPLPIRKVGGYRFLRHPEAEVLIAAWQVPGMVRPAVWLPRKHPPPARLVAWVRGGGRVGAHNAAFERLAWRYVLRRMHPSLPEVADSQWVCTAAMAAASGLPRALDKATAALELEARKDTEGSKLIKVFCQPRKPTKKDQRTRILPEDDPRFPAFIEYCRQDVVAEAALHAALPELTAHEQKLFQMDLRMNDRGLPIDLPLVEQAYAVVQKLEAHIGTQVAELTGGIKATQVAKMLDLFRERGIELENMRAETVRQLLKRDDLDADTRRLLELRVEAGRASTKKLAAMLACTDPDDHVVQGGFLWHGAHTGRYAGRLVQPHNFIRGNLKAAQAERVFRLLAHGDADLFIRLYANPIDIISQCMRGFIRAPEGFELAVADYTAIEARVLAWVAGEEHMLEAYRKGLDVYKLMAMRLWHLESIEEVTSEQRRIAKNLVLGCGYQLGGAKFVDYAANAGVIITEEFAQKAVKAYRDGHPAIKASWKTVEQLVVEAIRTRERTKGLRCEFFMREHWLCIQLPSGREIRYPYARVTLTERYDKPHWQISFRTEIKGRFLRETTYGGKLIENIVQAIARDVMVEGLFTAEQNDYPPIGTVHDEALTLRARGTSDIKHLEKLICQIRPWAKGIPLASEGFVCERYRK